MKKKLGLQRNNILFYISALAFLALRTISIQTARVSLIIGIIVLIYGLCNDCSYRRIDGIFKNSKISILPAAVFSLYQGYNYYSAMINSSKIKAIAEHIDISHTTIIATFAIIGCCFTLYFFIYLICIILSKINVNDNKFEPGDNLLKFSFEEIIVCILSALIVITICSKSSPLYPFNDWVDANCYFTVGKSILSGHVPYRDLLDHKGPLLHFLHALAAIISYRSFLGVYLLEIIACSIFLAISRKIMNLYRKNSSTLWILILAAVVYSSKSFCQGDSAEELCLPLVTLCLYYVIKSIRLQKDITAREAILIGITSGIVFWVKYTLLGIYFGLLIAYTIVKYREKKVVKLVQTLLYVLVGVIIVSVPILLYFLSQKAIMDLFTVYFYDNIFSYTQIEHKSTVRSILSNLIEGEVTWVNYSLLPSVLTLFGLTVMGYLNDRKEMNSWYYALLFSFCSIYAGGQHYKYYSFILNCFASIGIVALMKIIKLEAFVSVKNRKLNYFLILTFCILFAYIRCENTYMIGERKENLPQYQFATIINESNDVTLMNYGFLDGGFYTTTGIIPSSKYFCTLNVKTEEIRQKQLQTIQVQEIDFVVTDGFEFNDPHYELIAESSYHFKNSDNLYRLYKRKN